MKINKIYIPRQIVLLLVLAIVLNIARMIIFDSTYFAYLLWNIFLAILPFIISSILLLYSNSNKLIVTPLLVISGIIWLLLLPNAPYIITDMIHIGRGKSVTTLYDTFLIFSSAWAGLILGFYSISHIEKIIFDKYGKRPTSLIIMLVMLITSFGMYLGRSLRFNSWDIFYSYSLLFKNVWSIFSQPSSYTDAYIFTGVSFVFLYTAYNAWKYTQKEPKANI